MSERNTGLFCPGHVPPDTIAHVFGQLQRDTGVVLAAEEAPRVGHGTHEGGLYTHIGLRLFEVAGLRLMDELELPDADDIEMVLGRMLSERHGYAVYLFFDEERGAGGGAVFESGQLISRVCCDGRPMRPVQRDLREEQVLGTLDPHDWIWELAGDAVEAAAARAVGRGVRNDDHINALIEDAGAESIATQIAAGLAAPASRDASSTAPTPAPGPAQRVRKRDRIRGWLGRKK